MSNFSKMLSVNVNNHIKTKQNQKFLSWAYAWSEFKKANEDASYKVIENENGMPYFVSDLGIIVKTQITANGETMSMWLPVMNGANQAMKTMPYEYITKGGKKSVTAATMMDINKTIMRCLTKNIAMFGLGLYVFSGEDAPSPELVDSGQIQEILNLIKDKKLPLSDVTKAWQIEKIGHLHAVNFKNMIEWLNESKG